MYAVVAVVVGWSSSWFCGGPGGGLLSLFRRSIRSRRRCSHPPTSMSTTRPQPQQATGRATVLP